MNKILFAICYIFLGFTILFYLSFTNILYPKYRLKDTGWYKSQFNINRKFMLSNCGPAVISMAIKYQTGYNIRISEIREQLGFKGKGGISLRQIEKILNYYNIQYEKINKIDIFKYLNTGDIIIILVNPKKITARYYYASGVYHYIILKGYDDKNFLVNDPVPRYWLNNNYGENRQYNIDEVMNNSKNVCIRIKKWL